MKKFIIYILLAVTAFISACSDADVASKNLSKAADYFEVNRRVVFYNGITGEYILVIQGLCSLGNSDTGGKISITCKVSPTEYKKHYLGLSNNVTFFMEQIDSSKVSPYHYTVNFKPAAIIPDINIK